MCAVIFMSNPTTVWVLWLCCVVVGVVTKDVGKKLIIFCEGEGRMVPLCKDSTKIIDFFSYPSQIVTPLFFEEFSHPLFKTLFIIEWARFINNWEDFNKDNRNDHIAYFLVHSLAHSLYFCRSVLYSLAISGTRGSSGLGSHSMEQMESRTCKGRTF